MVITESTSTEIFVYTFFYFIFVILIRKILLNEKLSKYEIIISPLMFFIWIGFSNLLLNSYFDYTLSSTRIPNNISYIFLTMVYISGIILSILYPGYIQGSNLQYNILILTAVYVILSLIFIYM